jgi:mRNA interferase RelE/StbE
MTYRIEFSRRARKQFKALPEEIKNRLQPKVDALQENPLPIGVVKLADEDDLYRLRVGDYRLIYQIQNEILVILVLKIGHRREVYQ